MSVMRWLWRFSSERICWRSNWSTRPARGLVRSGAAADGGAVHGPIGQQQKALHDVAQLADIARPGIALQFLDGVLGEGLGLPSVLFGHARGEVRGEGGNVLNALAERRQEERKNVNAVVEILAESAAFHEVVEVAVRGDDGADVDGDGAVAADALDLAFLQHAKEFGLHDHGHARWRSSRFSSSRRLSLRTLSTVSRSLSVESGFSRKSTAPR